MESPQHVSIVLPCTFTQAELDLKLTRLNTSMLEYEQVETERGDVAKTYNEKLKALRVEVKALSRSINRMSEDRAIECVITYHVPEVGMKTTVRTDTGEVVATEPMTDDERQANLFDALHAPEGTPGAPDAPEAECVPSMTQPSAQAGA